MLSVRESAPVRESKIYDTVIAGMGPAGLTIAKQLSSEGIDVLGLEARDVPGGRIATRGGVMLGAGLVHGNHSPVIGIANNLGLTLTPLEGDTSSMDDLPNINDFAELLPEAEDRENAKAYAERHGLVGANEPALFRYLDDDDEPLALTSARFLESWIKRSKKEYDEQYAENDYIIEEGYDKIVDELAVGTNISFRKEVRYVDWSGRDHVRIGFMDGRAKRMVRARTFVCALPNAILRSGMVEFDPALPTWKTQAIGALGNVETLKLIYQFDRPVFPDGVNYILNNPGNPSEFWGDGRTVYGWCAGDNAREVLELPSEDALQLGLRSLEVALHRPLPKPVFSQAVDWSKIEYSRGTYPFVPPTASDNVHETLGRQIDNLFFVGDSTHWDPSTVNSAIRSALRGSEEVKLFLS